MSVISVVSIICALICFSLIRKIYLAFTLSIFSSLFISIGITASHMGWFDDVFYQNIGTISFYSGGWTILVAFVFWIARKNK